MNMFMMRSGIVDFYQIVFLLFIITFILFLFIIPIQSFSQTSTQCDDILFVAGSQTLGNTRCFGLDIGDIDLDGDNDVFMTNYIGASKLWINMGQRVFVESDQDFYASSTVSSEAHDVAIGDLNGDSFPDIFIAFHHYPSRVFFNDTEGGFVDSGQDIGESDDFPQTIQLNDIDGDGDLDAMMLLFDLPSKVLFNNGSGFFSEGETSYGGDAKELFLANLNEDNYPDLILSLRSQPNQVWFNNGSGTFINSNQELTEDMGSICTGDIDGDGDLDIVASNDNQIITYINQDNSGMFSAGTTINEGALNLAIIDAESDGDPDLITTHITGGNKLWLNDGNGIFSSMGAIFDTQRVFCIGIGNLETDNDDDIIFGQLEGTGGNTLYFNESTTTDVQEIERSHSSNFRLHKNYPDPFNSTTRIPFEIQKAGGITLSIFNILGKQIIKQKLDDLNKGYHEMIWNGCDSSGDQVKSGIYFCNLNSSLGHNETIRIHLVR